MVDDSLTFAKPPPNVGFWVFPGSGQCGLRFYMEKRPRWLTRVLMRLLLQFKWVDIQ